MPPPRRAKIEISEEPNAKPIKGCKISDRSWPLSSDTNNIKKSPTPRRPRPTTNIPVMAPPLNATLRASFIPTVAACAVLTLARTETFMPMKPQAPDNTAPITNPMAVARSRNTAIRMVRTTPTIAMVLY